MTNTINSVTIAIVWLVAVTNWTGHRVGTNELGYIATNHVLKCEYQGKSYDFTLKTEPGTTAVWRENWNWLTEMHFFTNHWMPGMVTTNGVIPNHLTLEADNVQGQP